MRIGPLDTCVVDVSTSIANFVLFMEISELVTSVLLNSLARGNLGFDFTGSNWIVPCVELIELLINAFRDGDTL